MILYLEYQNGSRRSWTIRSFEDLVPIVMSYPQVASIAEHARDLREAVQNVSNYLSEHAMDSWVEEDGFQKSVRRALAGVGLAAAMSLAPTPVAPDLPMPEHARVQPATTFGTEPEDAFLRNIMQLESSGGKNTNHKPVGRGAFKGQRAIGRWGMLLPTVNEVVGRMEQGGLASPDIQRIKGMGRDGLASYLAKNPQTELSLARYLARHVLTRHHGDARRAAYAWKHGHNLFPADVTEADLAKEPYVKDFSNLSRGDTVRGLKGSKMFVRKSERQGDFRARLAGWREAREAGARRDFHDLTMERNRGLDPGRRIDPSEEKDLRTKTGKPRKDLKNSIEEAKRSRLKP